MKKFLCKLFQCCPEVFGTVEAAIRLRETIKPTEGYLVREEIFSSTGRKFGVMIFAERVILTVEDVSLEVAVNKVVASYRQQA